MKEKEFLKKLNREENFNGIYTYAYVKKLLEESSLSKKTHKIRELFYRLIHNKSSIDIIKDNFLKILHKTHPEYKVKLIGKFLNNPELIVLVEKHFAQILQDLNDNAESRDGICDLIKNYYDGSVIRKKFIAENIDSIIKNTNKTVLIKIIPSIINLLPELKEKINEALEENKLEVARDMLLESISREIKKEGIIDDIDIIDYSQTLAIIIDEILESENKRWVDITKLAKGGYSTVYRIGNKILKVGDPRVSYKIRNHRKIIQPLLRTNLIGKNSKEIFSCIEIMDYVDTKFTNKEKRDSEFVYKIYKELRDVGIKWTDPKWENVGKLIRPNIPTLNSKEMYVEPNSVGFDKENEDNLEPGEFVIIDVDFIFDVADEEIYYGGKEYYEFERRYKKERALRSSKTLTRQQIRNLIFELRTEDNGNEIAILLDNLTNMSDKELKKLLSKNKTIGDLEREIEGNLVYLEFERKEKRKTVKEQKREK